MHATPREKLRELVQRFGPEIGRDARRCEALLRDVCGSFKKEIFALSSAVKEGIPAEIDASSAGVPTKVLLTRYAKRLHENLGIADDLCLWTVETWAYALGHVTKRDLQPATRCPQCDTAIKIPAQFYGNSVKCPKCAARLIVAPDGSSLQLRAAQPAVRSASAASLAGGHPRSLLRSTLARVLGVVLAVAIIGVVYLLFGPDFERSFSKLQAVPKTEGTTEEKPEQLEAKIDSALQEWLPPAQPPKSDQSGVPRNLLSEGDLSTLVPSSPLDPLGGEFRQSLRGKVTKVELTDGMLYCHVEFPGSISDVSLKHFTVFRKASLDDIESTYIGKLQFVRQQGSEVICQYRGFTPNIDDIVVASDADDVVE